MSRVQLALNVDDLEQGIAFYSALFRTAPAKVKPGYANFAVAEPPLKLVLIESPGQGGTLNHLGVEVASTEVVQEETARLAEAGLVTAPESGTCCYAQQDKVWVSGPGGEAWEVYTVLADSDTFRGTTEEDSTCCAPTGAEAGTEADVSQTVGAVAGASDAQSRVAVPSCC